MYVSIVQFYNTRDIARAGWPPPEVSANVNTAEMGNLDLNRSEELAIVAFLETLNDGYKPSLVVKAAEAAEVDQGGWQLYVPALMADQVP